MSLLPTREEITIKVLKELDDNGPESIKEALRTWWVNPREHGGFRLTTDGILAFQRAKLTQYELPLIKREDLDPSSTTGPPQESWSRVVLALQHNLTTPYFLFRHSGKITVIVFDGRIASICMLYGSVYDYILSIMKMEE
jgi:hypothetical protein